MGSSREGRECVSRGFKTLRIGGGCCFDACCLQVPRSHAAGAGVGVCDPPQRLSCAALAMATLRSALNLVSTILDLGSRLQPRFPPTDETQPKVRVLFIP